MTDEQVQEQYSKLKQIDKFAKELGFTIRKIDCDFCINNEVYHLTDRTLN